MIRKHGGNIKETYGVPVKEIVEGIKHGVRKVNIDTDIRLAMTGAIRKKLSEDPEDFDPRGYLKAASNAASEICKERFQSFGSAGKIYGMKVTPLDEISEMYTSGKLTSVIV